MRVPCEEIVKADATMKKIIALVFGVVAVFVVAGSAVAGSTPYTTEAAFKAASGAGPFDLNDFNTLNGGQIGVVDPSELTFSIGGPIYTISSPPSAQVFSIGGAIGSLNGPADPYLLVSIPSGATAIGANFFGTDDNSSFGAVRLLVTLSDGTSQDFFAGTMDTFLGFVSGGPLITSMEIHNPTYGQNGLYPTMDNLYVVGDYVPIPEPSVVMMNLAVLMGVGGVAAYYRRRNGQRN